MHDMRHEFTRDKSLTASTYYWVVIQHSRTSYNFIPIIMIIVAFSLSDFDWTFNIAERRTRIK